jgi:formylmethanofuran dehydrogenase subunit E
MKDRHGAQLEAYRIMSDGELFEVMEVEVALEPQDMPGRPLRRVRCEGCGEYVQDMRELREGGSVLCRPCSKGGYYKVRKPSLL